MKELNEGMLVYLKVPYRGYRAAILIEKLQYKWLVEFCGLGLQIEVYEDELDTD